MKSTGEVMGISYDFGIAFSKAQSAAKNNLPKEKGKVFISLANIDKEFAPKLAKELVNLGFSLCATAGTYKVISEAGIECEMVLKVSEGRPNIIDSLTNDEIIMAINTSDNEVASIDDGIAIRRTVLKMNIPYFTTVAGAIAAIEALKHTTKDEENEPKSLQEYLWEG